MVRSLGADEVVDYTKEDFTAGANRYDVILDMVGNHSLSALRRVLNVRGTYVMVGGPKGRWITPLDRALAAKVYSWFVSQKMSMMLAHLNQEDLGALRDLLQAGKVKPVIDRTYPLSQVPEALRYLEAGSRPGEGRDHRRRVGEREPEKIGRVSSRHDASRRRVVPGDRDRDHRAHGRRRRHRVRRRGRSRRDPRGGGERRLPVAAPRGRAGPGRRAARPEGRLPPRGRPRALPARAPRGLHRRPVAHGDVDRALEPLGGPPLLRHRVLRRRKGRSRRPERLRRRALLAAGRSDPPRASRDSSTASRWTSTSIRRRSSSFRARSFSSRRTSCASA